MFALGLLAWGSITSHKRVSAWAFARSAASLNWNDFAPSGRVHGKMLLASLVVSATASAAESCDGAKGEMPASLVHGHPLCPCLDVPPANLTTEMLRQGIDETTYGKGSCAAWNSNTLDCGGSGCAPPRASQWCYSAWCYVDPYNCRRDWQLSTEFLDSGRACQPQDLERETSSLQRAPHTRHGICICCLVSHVPHRLLRHVW